MAHFSVEIWRTFGLTSTVYNSETGFFSKISESLYGKLYDGDFDKIETEPYDTLVSNKIIVNDCDLYNYYYSRKMRFNKSSNKLSNLRLVLVPTTGCNFACPYCFEGEKQSLVMKDETIDDLIKFINSHAQAETLSIIWYGGEPLTAFGKMKKIISHLEEETNLVIKSQSIVTNGYLITDKIISFFKENKFDSIQITLDGEKDSHNHTRCLVGSGKPTYDKILCNIGKLVNQLPDCLISVRVNINKNNQDDFSRLYHKLSQIYSGDNFRIYPGFIREDTSSGIKMCYNSLCGTGTYLFYKRMADAGVDIDFFPHKTGKGCMTNCMSSYIIGPQGEIYKCWNDVNHPDKIISYINHEQLVNKSLLYRYYNEATPFEASECKSCLLFPVCSGGCAWYRYKNLFENKQFDVCSFMKDKHILEDCLINSLKQSDSPIGKTIKIS